MNHTFEITNTIPVPPKRARNSKYPFKVMNVNDSFFVPNAKASVLYAAAKVAGRKANRKFTVRATVERGLAGARVWRVE